MGTAGRDFERDREDELHCRICASDIPRNDGVHIFAEDGRRHYLQTKIRKYLYILVSSEDKFSKMVCVTCIKRIESIHRFAMMAYRTQEKLRLQLYSSMDNTNVAQDVDAESIKDTQDETRKVEDRGLLHTILTKGAIEILAEGEPLGPSELMSQEDKCQTPSMEEMEVKVDPMLFLQYGMEQSESETSETSDTEDKITSVDSLEPLSLTNKTEDIKKEKEEENNDDRAQVDDEELISNAPSKPYECTICSRSFISQIGLQNHLWSHLPKDKRADGKPILRSQQVYSTNGVLHMNTDNNSSGNFVCPICSKKISTKGNLKVHLETHRPKGKYGCDICGRIFKTQSNLFRHKEYHGGIQFPCNVCGRVYPTNSTLRAHSITHSDLRPHACPLCDKTFKRNQDLKFHINQHTGARPYQCPYCPKAFASSDLYQITMAYAYWKSGKVNDHAVFDLYFRKNPFQGEFTIFAGLEECIKFLEKFNYSSSDIKYLKSTMPSSVDQRFFDYLKDLTPKDVTIYAMEEGSVAFPRIPLLRVEGPLIMVQLLETTLLTLVNYASLMATNAARYRMVAGKNITLLEFGLRRAQGPDGGLSASKYSYMGGFDGTSNVLAGKLYDIPVSGTHAHAYITSFIGIDDLQERTLAHKETGEVYDLLELAYKHQDSIAADVGTLVSEASSGELAALISYAIAFPQRFVALVDTYDVKSIETTAKRQARITSLNVKNKRLTNGSNSHAQNGVGNNPILSEPTSHHKNDFLRRGELGELYVRSGLLNFCAVALALNDLGYKAIGIRIDSGDLAYLSNAARDIFERIAIKYNIPWFAKLMICASNDINEETILSLNEQSHKIDCFGIGTHLVTCQRQPALGCVYKMVEINNQPRMKLSQEVGKVTIPGKKDAFRLYGTDGYALIDLLQRSTEEVPQVKQKVLCRHPFQESKRAYVIPTRVESLHKVYWKNGKLCQPLPTLHEVRNRVQESLKTLRNDHRRNLNPTPYKVAVSDDLYNFIHDLWLQNAPIGELS